MNTTSSSTSSSSATSPSSQATDRSRWLWLPAFLLAAGLMGHGPIVQWAGYHDFADTRGWAGLPNAANLLSNLAFLMAGLWGLVRVVRHGASSPAWGLFALAVLLTAFGSAAYHWAPSAHSLLGDRLPIAWACAALTCAFLAERVNAHWAQTPALLLGLAVATASVFVWWWGELQQHGDLRLYAFVQFMPMLVIPLALWLRLPARSPQTVPDTAWWLALALYGCAKLMELGDQAVLQGLGGFVSGHTLKHLLAAGAATALLHAATARPGQLR